MKNINILFAATVFFTVYSSACQINPYKSGEALYTNFCSNCHGAQGEGLGDLYPPIDGADYLRENSDQFACMIKHGMEGNMVVNGKTYNEIMPANPRLDEVAITNIANYVNYRWPYRSDYTTITEVRDQLSECE